MRKLLFIILCFAAAISAISLSSCSSDKRKVAELEEIPQYTKDDTLRIFKATEDFMTKLQESNLNGAMDMLHKLHHDSIIPISAEERSEMIKQFNTMPVLSFEVERLEMKSPIYATISYKYKFMENPTDDKNFPCTTHITLFFQQHKGKAFIGTYEHAEYNGGGK